jgi:hypothetical protein
MNRYERAMVAALATMALLAGCTTFGVPDDFNGVVGEGPIVDEDRQVDEPVTAVRAGGGMKVRVTQGTPQSVRLSGQANILAILEATVADGVLTLESTDSYSTGRDVTATIVVERLDGLELWGGASGDIRGLDAARVALEVSGGAQVTAAGHTHDLLVIASSGGAAHLHDLHVTDAEIECSGGAEIELTATGSVEGEAWGGATVELNGDPATVDVEVSGGSSLE